MEDYDKIKRQIINWRRIIKRNKGKEEEVIHKVNVLKPCRRKEKEDDEKC